MTWHTKLVPVAEILGTTLYAARTAGGGIAFFDDETGVQGLVVDFTVTDPAMVRLALEILPILDKHGIPGEKK